LRAIVFAAVVVIAGVFAEAAGADFAAFLAALGLAGMGVDMLRLAATGAGGLASGTRAGGLGTLVAATMCPGLVAELLIEGWGGATAGRSTGCFPLQARTWTDSAAAPRSGVATSRRKVNSSKSGVYRIWPSRSCGPLSSTVLVSAPSLIVSLPLDASCTAAERRSQETSKSFSLRVTFKLRTPATAGVLDPVP
jgi:hypothetical protein